MPQLLIIKIKFTRNALCVFGVQFSVPTPVSASIVTEFSNQCPVVNTCDDLLRGNWAITKNFIVDSIQDAVNRTSKIGECVFLSITGDYEELVKGVDLKGVE